MSIALRKFYHFSDRVFDRENSADPQYKVNHTSDTYQFTGTFLTFTQNYAIILIEIYAKDKLFYKSEEKMTNSIPLSCHDVHLTDSFFKGYADLVRREVIPYQWETLNDRVEGAAPSYCMRNFRVAAKRLGHGFSDEPCDEFDGYWFQDTDFYKWIEAVGYSLSQNPDENLMKIADDAVDVVCAAQCDDGYLDTFYTITDPENRFTNLRDNHELYCLGHLIEGAIGYYEATGHDKLLNAARRYADCVYDRFGYDEGKLRGYPGHEIAELALVKLYQLTGEKKYLDLALFFINERGTTPNYFAREHGDPEPEPGSRRYEYHQAHKPVREQDEAVGHAVRAVYLYAGMAAAARETGDQTLVDACRKLWDNIENKKFCITGGIGASPAGEAFSYNYNLPNDTMYNETCASIGLVFFARRMLELEVNSRYADVMERALYNGIPSGMALDGKSFFYVNPLEVEPRGCREDAFRRHVALPRQKWFGCACCPPNIARLMASIQSYAFGKNDDTLFIHLYAAGEIDTEIGDEKLRLTFDGEYPWNDTLKLRFMTDSSAKVALRIPDWCGKILIDGKEFTLADSDNGYVYINGSHSAGDELTITLPMKPVFRRANTRVRADIAKTALMRGPIVYCAEEADNGANLHLLEVDPHGSTSLYNGEGVLHGTVCVTVDGRRISNDNEDELYTESLDYSYTPVTIKYVPYYTWDNRGVGEMAVWLRRSH